MKFKLIIMVALIGLGYAVVSARPAVAHNNQSHWEERQAKIKALVDAEVAHRRAVEIEKAKAEVLARTKLLESSPIYVSSYSSTKVKNTLTQENTASATA